MKTLRAWMRRLTGMMSNERREKEFASELEGHLQMHVDDNLRAGMTPQDARRDAILKLGGLEMTRQAYRERGTVPFFETLLQDLRFAIRQLRKNPGFACTAVLVLALGIGASVAIFGFVDAALIKSLPYERPPQLVSMFESNQTGPRFHLSYLDYLDWKKLNHVFRSMALYEEDDFMLSTAAGVQQANGIRVSDGFFRTLGVNPVLGLDFNDGDDLASASTTVMLSYTAWQKRFNGRRDALGQTVILNGTPASIIGVLPSNFHFAPGRPAEFWLTIPAAEKCSKQRGCHNFYGIGRLKDGISVAVADAEMKTIAKQLEKQYPDSNRNRGATVISLTDLIFGDIRPILLVLLSGAGLLLLIASVNVASLLLVRAENRKREVALRGALGATPARLIRQFVTEGLLLAAGGSVLGVVSAYAAMQALTRLIPTDRMASMPYLQGIGLNLRVLGFACVISLLAGMIFSLTPLLRLSFRDVNEGLAEGGRSAAGTVWRRFGANLVVIELAAAMILLVGAGLLGKSFYRLLHVDTGLQPENLAMLQIWSTPSAFAKDVQQLDLERKVLDRLTSLPAVKSVTVSSDLPVGDGDGIGTLQFVGRPELGADNEVNDRVVSPSYFATLQARLLHGRYFAETDDSSRPLVAIVNEALAKRYLPAENPLGKRIAFDEKKPLEIIGVVDDIKEGPLDIATRPVVYLPFNQEPDTSFYVIVRTSQNPQWLLVTMAAAIHQISPEIATYNAVTMTDHIHDSPSAYLHRSSAWLVGGFAAMALLLGVVGLYGVIAYSVSQRTREIGVRMALGAQRGSVYRMILSEAGWLAAVGITIGVTCSLAATTLLRSLLFGVHAWDIPTLAIVAAVLAVAALLASYIPARRAASINPVEALRAE
jgi:macrolide transport system ATP-binding/permease protein